MTICFFSAQYFPTVGGVERYTFNLAKKCSADGHRVIIVTSLLSGTSPSETDENGFLILRLPSFLLMNGRFPTLKPCGELYRQLKRLWSEKPDFCVINTRFYPLSVYAAFACKSHSVRAIVVEHSTGHMPLKQPFISFCGHLYEHFACFMIYSRCKNFYGVSNAVCRWLQHFHVAAKGTLHNSVDPEALQQELDAANKTDYRQKLRLSSSSRIVFYAGRMIEEKGAGNLIRAFSETGDSLQAELFLAGDGPVLEALRDHTPAHVHFLGSLPHQEVLSLMQQADIYCLPTLYAEGFPTTFLEAAYCGCSIVTTKTGGTEELMPDESFGLSIPIDYTVSQLSDALQKMLSDPERRSIAAEKTKQQLLRFFTWDETYRQFQNIISDH